MIIHLDADAFYASVEQVENPELRGKAMAVGGRERGIIASATYEARARGVYTPMPVAWAKRACPELILVRGDMAKYVRYSRRIFALIEDYTPLVERTSIDEGYFDVSGHRTMTPFQIAAELKERILADLGLTVSFGIGANKLISQIASKSKKPNALVEVPRGTEREFLAPLPVRWLPGVGTKTEPRYLALGLKTIRDVAEASRELLVEAAGRYGEELRQRALGIDDRPVEVEHEDAKSYGVQDTFFENVGDRETLLTTLRGMADGLMSRVRRDGKAIRTMSVKVRYADFTDTAHASTLDVATDLETDVYPHLPALLRGAWKRREPLRLISLRFSGVTEPVFQSELPLDGSVAHREKQQRAARLLDELRARSLPLVRGHSVRKSGDSSVES